MKKNLFPVLGLLFLTLVAPAQAGQTTISLPSSATGVVLQTAYPGYSSFLLGSGGVVTNASDGVAGDNSQTWQFTNYGRIESGTGVTGSGVKLGSAVSDMATVWNHGSILSMWPATNGPSGVQFTNGGRVYNYAGARIEGYDGVHNDNGTILSVDNHGVIYGSGGGGSAIYSGQAASIRNYLGGVISGTNFGLNVNGRSRDVLLLNYGLIGTRNTAVHLYQGNAALLHNAPTGVIRSGGGATVYLEESNGYLLNEGLIEADNTGVQSTNSNSGNVYANTGAIIAHNGSAFDIQDAGNVIYNLGVLSGTTSAIQLTGGNNLLALGTQAYLPRLGYTVYGPGSQLVGDAISTVAGNRVLLTDSGSEDNSLTGFESLTMNGDDWSLFAPLTLGFGANPGLLSTLSGRLSLYGDLTAANAGTVAVADGGTLSLYAGLAANSANVAGGGTLEYGGTAGNFANLNINVAPAGLFRLSRLDSRLTLDNTVGLNLASGSFFGVTVGLDPNSHSILYADTFAPQEGVLLDVNGHTIHAVGVSALPAGGYFHPGVVQANNPVAIPQSMRIAGNPLVAAALLVNPGNPNWADLDLYLRNINDVYGPHIEAADVWRLSSLPTRAQRLWLDAMYRAGRLGPEGERFFQVLDGHPVFAASEAMRTSRRHLLDGIGDRLRIVNDLRLGDVETALRAVGSPAALARRADAAGYDNPWRPQYAVWASAGQFWSSQDSRGNVLGYDYNPYNLTLGVDRAHGNWITGLATQYEQGDVEAKSGWFADSETRIRAAAVGLYAGYQAPRWYGHAGAQLGYGWNREKTRYPVWNQWSDASYRSGLFGANVEFGKHFSFGDSRLPFRATPHLGVDYGRVRQSAFNETGSAPVARSFDKNVYNILEAPLGVRLSKAFAAGGSVYVPFVDAVYAHNFGDSRASGDAAFVSLPGQPWRGVGVDSGREAFRLSAGLNARINDRVDFALSYNLEVRNNYVDQGARAGVGISF